MSKLKNIISRSGVMSVSMSTIICTGITFLYGLITKRYVEPQEYGIYTICTMFLNYMSYLQFGVLNAYNRDYPQLLGSGNIEKARKVKNVVFTYFTIVYTSAAVIMTVVVLPLWVAGILDSMLAIGLILTGLVGILSTAFSFFDITARMDNKLFYSASVNLIKTIGMFVVGSAAVIVLSKLGKAYYGLFAAVIISSVLALLCYIKIVTSMRFRFDKNIIKTMIFSGLPLLFNSLIWTLVSSVDKFVILGCMPNPETQLGIYSTALLGFSTLVVIPTSFTQVFYIKMSRKYGESGSQKVLLDYAKRYTLIISLFSSIISVIAYFFLPVFINAFLPKYAASTASAQIIAIGVAFYSTAMLFSNIYSVLKWNKKLLLFTSSLCIFNAVFSLAFVYFISNSLESVAYGTSLSYLIYSFILISVLAKNLKVSILGMLKVSWLPVVFTVVPCLVLDFLNRQYNILGGNDILACIFALIIGFGFILIFLFNDIKQAVLDLFTKEL